MNKGKLIEAGFIGGMICILIGLSLGAMIFSLEQLRSNNESIPAICFWGLVTLFIVHKGSYAFNEAITDFINRYFRRL